MNAMLYNNGLGQYSSQHFLPLQQPRLDDYSTYHCGFEFLIFFFDYLFQEYSFFIIR